MKVVVTADLHFEIARSLEPATRIAEAISASAADVLIIAGDVYACDPPGFAESLARFGGFKGRKLLVAGNHDLWTHGGDSAAVYADMGKLAAGQGFHFLDDGPAVIGDVAFVGNIGWYDLSYRRESLGIPLRFYQAKVSPGAAALLEEHRALLSGEAPSPQSMNIRARWRDATRVRWKWTDEQFLDRCLQRLTEDLAAVEPNARAIVAVTHHLPFAELVVEHGVGKYDFAAAYLGSPRIGELLERHPKIKYAFCGHSHRPGRLTRNGLTCINVGSTYTEKRSVEIDV